MSINSNQLQKEIIEPTLRRLDLHSKAAVHLLLGTCAQESHMGEYIRQLGNGPALGIYQMEPATHDDIVENFLQYKRQLKQRIAREFGYNNYIADRMIYDLRYATVMARLHYFRVAAAIPPSTQIEALAAYWKRYYNTHLGAGTVEEFIENYNRFVKA